jgi:hypothetical protein
MKNMKYNKIWQKYADAKTDAEQYAIMQEFMLSASLEELLEWNRFLAEKGDKSWAEHRKNGLSDADKEWYASQFTQFDDLENQIKLRKVA